MESDVEILLAGGGLEPNSSTWDPYRASHQLHYVENLDEAPPIARAQKPRLVFLGRNSSSSHQAEICQQLTSDPQTGLIPVIFVCEDGSLEEKLSAYEAGAFDYVNQIPEIIELRAKLALFEKHRKAEDELAIQAKLATDTAMSAMSGSSELGQAIRFVERSYSVQGYEQLAEAFFSVTSGFSLNCALYFSTTIEPMFFSSTGNPSPLECELLRKIHTGSTRIQDYGVRTFIRYPRVVLLVKNMPLTDETRYGRIKDLLPSMLGAADAKVKALDTRDILIKQTQDVGSAFMKVRETLQELENATAANQEGTIKIMRDMLHELDFKIPGMGLDEDQEEYLLNRIDQSVEKASAVMNQSEMLRSAFHSISALLAHLATDQEKILSLAQADAQDDEPPADVSDGDDIELF